MVRGVLLIVLIITTTVANETQVYGSDSTNGAAEENQSS